MRRAFDKFFCVTLAITFALFLPGCTSPASTTAAPSEVAPETKHPASFYESITKDDLLALTEEECREFLSCHHVPTPILNEQLDEDMPWASQAIGAYFGKVDKHLNGGYVGNPAWSRLVCATICRVTGVYRELSLDQMDGVAGEALKRQMDRYTNDPDFLNAELDEMDRFNAYNAKKRGVSYVSFRTGEPLNIAVHEAGHRYDYISKYELLELHADELVTFFEERGLPATMWANMDPQKDYKTYCEGVRKAYEKNGMLYSDVFGSWDSNPAWETLAAAEIYRVVGDSMDTPLALEYREVLFNEAFREEYLKRAYKK